MTASGVTLFGIGSAFWGLGLGYFLFSYCRLAVLLTNFLMIITYSGQEFGIVVDKAIAIANQIAVQTTPQIRDLKVKR